MANWTKATLYKRLVDVIEEEIEVVSNDRVLSKDALIDGDHPALDAITANDLLNLVKRAVVKEAMGE